MKTGEECPLSPDENSRGAVEHLLSFELIPNKLDKFKYGRVISDIRYDVVGKRTYCVSTTEIGLRVVVQIEYTAGSKIITIRSDRVVKNSTSFDLEVSLLNKNARFALTLRFDLTF